MLLTCLLLVLVLVLVLRLERLQLVRRGLGLGGVVEVGQRGPGAREALVVAGQVLLGLTEGQLERLQDGAAATAASTNNGTTTTTNATDTDTTDTDTTRSGVGRDVLCSVQGPGFKGLWEDLGLSLSLGVGVGLSPGVVLLLLLLLLPIQPPGLGGLTIGLRSSVGYPHGRPLVHRPAGGLLGLLGLLLQARRLGHGRLGGGALGP